MHVLNGVSLGHFAVKKVPVGDHQEWLVRMLREVHLLEKLRHPNIIEYKHAWLELHQLTLFGPTIPCLFILMEQANGGNLEEYVQVQWTPGYDDFPWEEYDDVFASVDRDKGHTHPIEQAGSVSAGKGKKKPAGARGGDDEHPSLSTKEKVLRARRLLRQQQQQQRSSLAAADTAAGTSGSGTAASSASSYASVKEEDDDVAARQVGGIGYGVDGQRVRYLSDREIWSFFLDVCRGLAHLHKHGTYLLECSDTPNSRERGANEAFRKKTPDAFYKCSFQHHIEGILHRDLKPTNLLLHYSDPSSRSEIPRVLISDFGECEYASSRNKNSTSETAKVAVSKTDRTGATGTLEFMAPELLRRDRGGRFTGTHSSKSDMWSLGIVLYYLCYSKVPYTQVDDVDVLKDEILAFERVPQELKRLIVKLLSLNPTDRPSAERIIETYERHAMTSMASAEATRAPEGKGARAGSGTPATSNKSTSGPSPILTPIGDFGDSSTDLTVQSTEEETVAVHAPVLKPARTRRGSIHTLTSPMASMVPVRKGRALQSTSSTDDDTVDSSTSLMLVPSPKLTYMEGNELMEDEVAVVKQEVRVEDDMLESKFQSSLRTEYSHKDQHRHDGELYDAVESSSVSARPTRRKRSGENHQVQIVGRNLSTTMAVEGGPGLPQRHVDMLFRLLGISGSVGGVLQERTARGSALILVILPYLIMLLKVATCIFPCMPYSPSPYLLFFLLILGFVDLSSPPGSARSITMLLIHIAVVMGAHATGTMCLS
ncbi:putative serine/threonine-protein kinase iks1 [Quaeritorhiza haematococci]|nr:putative serine/threonine-protein kinase iks1 [Quaeritorhiza haematococci]